MEVNIDSKEIHNAIVRAITDSAIGEQVKNVIETELEKKDSYYDTDTIIGKAIKTEVNRLIVIIIRDEIEKNKNIIRESVIPTLTDEIIRQMASTAIEVMLGNLGRA